MKPAQCIIRSGVGNSCEGITSVVGTSFSLVLPEYRGTSFSSKINVIRLLYGVVPRLSLPDRFDVMLKHLFSDMGTNYDLQEYQINEFRWLDDIRQLQMDDFIAKWSAEIRSDLMEMISVYVLGKLNDWLYLVGSEFTWHSGVYTWGMDCLSLALSCQFTKFEPPRYDKTWVWRYGLSSCDADKIEVSLSKVVGEKVGLFLRANQAGHMSTRKYDCAGVLQTAFPRLGYSGVARKMLLLGRGCLDFSGVESDYRVIGVSSIVVLLMRVSGFDVHDYYISCGMFGWIPDFLRDDFDLGEFIVNYKKEVVAVLLYNLTLGRGADMELMTSFVTAMRENRLKFSISGERLVVQW